MKRVKFDSAEVQNDVINAVLHVRDKLDLTGEITADAWATLETFSAIALRLMAVTNASKVRSIAMTVEIQNLMKPEFKRAEVPSQNSLETRANGASEGVTEP